MAPAAEISKVPCRQPGTLFLLGGYTDKSVLAHNPAGGEGEGIYSALLDPQTGKLERLTSSSVKTNPAFIMKHPDLDIIYMTTEVISDSGSELLTGELDRKTGTVTVIDRKPVHGRSTCHLEWDSDRSHLIAVSYWDSKLTTFPVGKDGRLQQAKQVYADPGANYVDEAKPDRFEHLAHRQRWPHLHQVNPDPYTNQFYMVPDLGRDQIHYFRIQAGEVVHLGVDQLPRGVGPRHMDFSRTGRLVYVCGELNNTVSVFRYNIDVVPRVLRGGYTGDTESSSSRTPLLSLVQTVSTVPQNLNIKSTIAEMRLHPSGKFLYVGNRGHNSLAIFRVSVEDGLLEQIGIQSSLGSFPRHFNFDLSGQFVVVGNHASDTVVVFRICENGSLEESDRMDNLPSVVWLTPVQHMDS